MIPPRLKPSAPTASPWSARHHRRTQNAVRPRRIPAHAPTSRSASPPAPPPTRREIPANRQCSLQTAVAGNASGNSRRIPRCRQSSPRQSRQFSGRATTDRRRAVQRRARTAGTLPWLASSAQALQSAGRRGARCNGTINTYTNWFSSIHTVPPPSGRRTTGTSISGASSHAALCA